jgi:hypothetical protein
MGPSNQCLYRRTLVSGYLPSPPLVVAGCSRLPLFPCANAPPSIVRFFLYYHTLDAALNGLDTFHAMGSLIVK